MTFQVTPVIYFGFQKKVHFHVDVFDLRSRVDCMIRNHFNKSYQVSKSKLSCQLENFLFELGSSSFSCSPYEVCLFLAWCDANGKTPVHVRNCSDIGVKKPVCKCPRRLALGTVKVKIAQLKALFEKMGRCGPWVQGKGNPAASEEVAIYQEQVREEQSLGHVAPSQAVPMFLPKVKIIAMYINRKLEEEMGGTQLLGIFGPGNKPGNNSWRLVGIGRTI